MRCNNFQFNYGCSFRNVTESATAQETAKSLDETRTESSEDLEDGARQRPIKREPEEANNTTIDQQPLPQQTPVQGLPGLQGGPGSPVMQLPAEELKKKGEFFLLQSCETQTEFIWIEFRHSCNGKVIPLL